MTKQRRTPYGYTIFCDDVREEVNNKFTYVGVYAESLIVPSLPVTLSKFVINTHFLQHPDDEIRPLKVVVYGPESETVPIFDLDVPFDNQGLPSIDSVHTTPMMDLNLSFVLSPFEIKHEGFIKVRFHYGNEVLRVGALRIVVADR